MRSVLFTAGDFATSVGAGLIVWPVYVREKLTGDSGPGNVSDMAFSLILMLVGLCTTFPVSLPALAVGAGLCRLSKVGVKQNG